MVQNHIFQVKSKEQEGYKIHQGILTLKHKGNRSESYVSDLGQLYPETKGNDLLHHV